jgi:DNA-binding MarR family transcriptional regulator
MQETAEQPTDGATRSLAERLRITVGRFVRSVRQEAETPTTSQSETLQLLEVSGPMSVAELASQRHVRHQSMRLVTAQLEAEGLVEKLPNPADGRSRLLSVTVKGRETLAAARSARTSRIAALIGDRLTEEERRTLEAAITIIDRLS